MRNRPISESVIQELPIEGWHFRRMLCRYVRLCGVDGQHLADLLRRVHSCWYRVDGGSRNTSTGRGRSPFTPEKLEYERCLPSVVIPTPDVTSSSQAPYVLLDNDAAREVQQIEELMVNSIGSARRGIVCCPSRSLTTINYNSHGHCNSFPVNMSSFRIS